MSARAVILAVVGLAGLSGSASASDAIKIKASRCALIPQERALTGFVLRGTQGIITALHGVADCSQILALAPQRSVVIEMRVSKEFAARDLALLEPLQPRGAVDLDRLDGFDAVTAPDTLRPREQVAAIGYPHAVLTPQTNDSLRVGDPTMERLGDILGVKNQDLVARGSPDADLRVIKLSGLVVKGESGAPLVLLSAPRTVVGVVIGSPDPGSSNIGWVVPVTALQWAEYVPARWSAQPLPSSLASSVGVPESTGAHVYELVVSTPGKTDIRAPFSVGTDGSLERLIPVTGAAAVSTGSLTIVDSASGAVVAQGQLGQSIRWTDAGTSATHEISTAPAGNAIAVGVSSAPRPPTNLRIVN